MASPPADASEFAVAVAVGYAHVLDRVLRFLERTSSARAVSPVVALSLALPVLAAYLVVTTIAFAVRVAADGYAHVVACTGGGGEDDSLAARVLAGLSPAAIFSWVASAVLKLAARLVLLGALGAALLQFAPVLELASLGQAKAS